MADLNHMTQVTRDYGRVLHRSTGLASLWTAGCLAGLIALVFGWSWQRFLGLGGEPHALLSWAFLRWLVRTREVLPTWLLLLAFALPFLWAVVMRRLTRRLYPERFGPVRGQGPAWLKGFEPLVGPMNRWAPMLFLTLLPILFWMPKLITSFAGKPGPSDPYRWEVLLAPVLGFIWFWIVPHLQKAEASDGTALVYTVGILLAGRYLAVQWLALPGYLLLIVAVMLYGIWAHIRYRCALATLEGLDHQEGEA